MKKFITARILLFLLFGLILSACQPQTTESHPTEESSVGPEQESSKNESQSSQKENTGVPEYQSLFWRSFDLSSRENILQIQEISPDPYKVAIRLYDPDLSKIQYTVQVNDGSLWVQNPDGETERTGTGAVVGNDSILFWEDRTGVYDGEWYSIPTTCPTIYMDVTMEYNGVCLGYQILAITPTDPDADPKDREYTAEIVQDRTFLQTDGSCLIRDENGKTISSLFYEDYYMTLQATKDLTEVSYPVDESGENYTITIPEYSTNIVEYTGSAHTTPEEAAFALSRLFMESLKEPQAERSFVVTTYTEPRVKIFATTDAELFWTEPMIQVPKSYECNENTWLVYFYSEYKVDGNASTIYNSPGPVWGETCSQDGAYGFRMVKDGNRYTLQSRKYLPPGYEIQIQDEDLMFLTNIQFGTYEQDGDRTNGAEAISWNIAARKEDKVLLVSSYVLDVQPYHDTKESVDWKNSSLRAWLNDVFWKNAFTEAEQEQILTLTLPNSGIKDPVFLLSETEILMYRIYPLKASPTSAAAALFSEVPDLNCGWWLRDMGSQRTYAAYVDENGMRISDGCNVTTSYGIRPAIWVDKDVLIEYMQNHMTEYMENLIGYMPNPMIG